MPCAYGLVWNQTEKDCVWPVGEYECGEADPEPITVIEKCKTAKVDLVFVLDSSGSVTAKNFEKVKGFVKDFLKDADIDNDAVRVGVNVYSSLSTVSFNLNTYSSKADVFNAIDAVPFKGQGTRTGLALEKMKYEMFTAANGDRDGVGNVAIVIADGESSDSPIPKADAAREAGIYMYAIGVGLANTEELEGIANKPSDEHVFSIEDFDALKDLGSKVLTAVCETVVYNGGD